MEGEGGPTATETASPSSSPPHEPDFSPVGSPDETVSDLPPLPSEDDHDHDHDHGPDQSAGTGGLTDDLKHKIIKQAGPSPALYVYLNLSCSLVFEP